MKNEKIEEAKALVAKATEENRSLTADEQTIVEEAISTAKSIKQTAELKSAVENLGNELSEVVPTEVKETEPKTIGQKLLNDKEFKSWLSSATRNGLPDPKSLPNSPSVEIGGVKNNLFTSGSNVASDLVVAERYPGVTATYARELTAMNLVTMGSTSSDLVEFVKVDIANTDNNAAPTAEGVASPESNFGFTKESAAVRDIRTFIPASTRALADAGQLETLTNNFLRYSINEKLEDQLLNGDGTGENWTGILNYTGVSTQAFDTDMITTIRKAIGKVRYVGKSRATAVLLNPADDEQVDLLTADGSGQYIFGGPVGTATPTIWGLPRIVSSAVPQGTAIVADFRTICVWERQGINLSVFPQHADYAIKGMVALAAGARAAMGILNPLAVVVATIAD